MNYKLLFIFVLGIVLFNSACATSFLNLTEHNAIDNTSNIFVESKIKMPNGEYSDVFGSKTLSDYASTYLSVEVWANESGVWESDPYHLHLNFKNYDTNTTYEYITSVYKTQTLLNSVVCWISNCVYLDQDGTSDSNGTSFIINVPFSEASSKMAENAGIFSFFDREPFSFGLIKAYAYVTDTSNAVYYSTTHKTNSVMSFNQISFDMADTIESEDYISYNVAWQSFYNPSDYAVTIVDNDSYVSLINQGYADNVINNTIAYSIGQNGEVEPSIFRTLEGLGLGVNASIYNLNLNGYLNSDNFYQSLVSGEKYHLIVFQKRFINENTYYMIIGSKEFTYVPTPKINNADIYSFDLGSRRLYNSSSADLYLRVYTMDLNSEIANGNIQPNFLDIYPYYFDKSTGSKTMLDYGTEISGSVIYLTLNVKDYNNFRDNKFYVSYGSDTTVTANANYIGAKTSGLYITNIGGSGINGSENIYSILQSDSVNVTTSSHGQTSGGCTSGCSNYLKFNNLAGTLSNYHQLACTGTSAGGCGGSPSLQLVNVYNSTNQILTKQSIKTMSSGFSQTTSWTNQTNQYLGFMRLDQLSNNIIISYQQDNPSQWWFTVANVYFNNDMWNLTLLSSQKNIASSITENSFVSINTYTYNQTFTVSSGVAPRNVQVFVDNKLKSSQIMDSYTTRQFNAIYTLSNNTHYLKVYVAGVGTITHQVTASGSNIKFGEDEVSLNSEIVDTSVPTSYSNGSISNIASNILTLLFGSWAIAPYFIALVLSIGVMIYSKNMGIGAITFLASLFVFSALGWITGWVANGLIVGVAIVFVIIIYNFLKGGSGG